MINERKNKGCSASFRVSTLTDEKFVCGVSVLSGNIWLCNDCLKRSLSK